MGDSESAWADREDGDASHLCIEAIELIYSLGLKPTPPIYGAFYAYAAKTDFSIVPLIHEALGEGRALRQAEIQSVHLHCSNTPSQNEQLQDVTCRLDKGVSDAASALEQAAASASTYCTSLDGTQQDLAGLRNPDGLAAIVADLVKTTREMQRQGAGVHKRLREITYEIEFVKHDLDKVRLHSHVDALTNTANRRMFDRAFAAAVADAETSGESFCLCMIDADHFKSFNDRHGHQAGDSVLKLIAGVLKSAVRDHDIVARYGGEEFAILLNGASLDMGTTIAERIRTNLAGKSLIGRGSGEHLGNVTVSLGVAQYVRGETVSTLLERADACLYQAKREGRNKVVSERDLDTRAHRPELRSTG